MDINGISLADCVSQDANKKKRVQDVLGEASPLIHDTVSSNIKELSEIARKYDVTNISPREVRKMSVELYQSGNISFKTHSILSFQLELDPDYNETHGKLMNKTAQPDTPRDFLKEWQDKLDFQMGTDRKYIDQTKEMVNILENLHVIRNNLDL